MAGKADERLGGLDPDDAVKDAGIHPACPPPTQLTGTRLFRLKAEG